MSFLPLGADEEYLQVALLAGNIVGIARDDVVSSIEVADRAPLPIASEKMDPLPNTPPGPA